MLLKSIAANRRGVYPVRLTFIMCMHVHLQSIQPIEEAIEKEKGRIARNEEKVKNAKVRTRCWFVVATVTNVSCIL